MDRIGEIGGRANERQAAGEYGIGFTVGSLARIGAQDRIRGQRIKVGSNEGFMEVERIT